MATALRLDTFVKAGPMTRLRAIETGLPIKMVRALMKDGEIGLTDLARFLAPRRTLDRRFKENQRLTIDESDRLVRFMKILDLCEYTFGNRYEAMDWLRSPLLAFDEQPPIDLLKTSAGADAVNNLLERGRHGMLA